VSNNDTSHFIGTTLKVGKGGVENISLQRKNSGADVTKPARLHSYILPRNIAVSIIFDAI